MKKFVLPLLFLACSVQSASSHEDGDNSAHFNRTMRLVSSAAVTSLALIPLMEGKKGPVRTLAKTTAFLSGAFLLNELLGRRIEQTFRSMFKDPTENKSKIAAALTLFALAIYLKEKPPESLTTLLRFLNTLGKGIKI